MDDEVLLGEYILPSKLSHYRNLMPAIDELLARVNITLSMLGGLIVAIGPGSFTGIRIGLSIVKGLSEYLTIPAAGVSTLESMASQIPFIKEDICPFVISRKGEVFTALFRWSDNQELVEVKQCTCLKIEDIGSIIENQTILIGNDYPDQATILRQQSNEYYIYAPAHMWNLRASAIGVLGLKEIRKGNQDVLNNLEPLYMRGADIRMTKNIPNST
jgi:tRNA threonylcarbamoyladenosine biosynthesis protein TsaB